MASPESQAFQEHMKDGRYHFTEEEKRVLQECRTESFWYRAFPLSAAAGVSTHLLVQRGILSPSNRFGSIPKVIFGTVCGYILGKMLYVQTCRQKFLKLENSPFAEMVRRGRGGMQGAGFRGMEIPGYGGNASNVSELQDDTLQQDVPWSGGHDQQLNMDIDTSQVNSFESDVQQRESNREDKREMTLTYDELRKRSREKNAQNYTQVLPGHYQPKSSQPPVSGQMPERTSERLQPPSQDDQFQLGARNRNRMVNKYGDSWEKE